MSVPVFPKESKSVARGDENQMGSWLLLVAALFFIGLGVSQVFVGKSNRRSVPIPPGLEGVSGEDYWRLLNMCNGDRAAVFRLIELEKRKHPNISNKQACRRAIDRHKNR